MNIISSLLTFKNWLQGKKTYFVCAAAAVVFFLNIMHYIPSDVATKIYEFLGITGAATLSAKFNHMTAQMTTVVESKKELG